MKEVKHGDLPILFRLRRKKLGMRRFRQWIAKVLGVESHFINHAIIYSGDTKPFVQIIRHAARQVKAFHVGLFWIINNVPKQHRFPELDHLFQDFVSNQALMLGVTP